MKLNLVIISLCCLSISLSAQKWTVKDPFEQKVFIENNGGQFDGGIGSKDKKILYSAVIKGVALYFTTDGVTYKYNEVVADSSDKDKHEEQDHIATKLIPHYFSLKWEGASLNPGIEPENKEQAYNTYYITGHNVIANGYKKLLYKNAYPNIDIEYSFPADSAGLEYSIIVHPGADLSKVKLYYSDAGKVWQNSNGNIEMQSSFGKFIDHAPLNSFYNGNKEKVSCSFKLLDNEITFDAGNYDHAKTLIIDPWVVNPGFTGYDKGYDLDYDFAGNVYVYGGLPPYQVEKFNSNGIAQWMNNLPFDTTELWAGDITVDHRDGSVYIVKGLSGFYMVNTAVKLNSAGMVVDTFGYEDAWEAWRVRFDYCNNQLVIGAGDVVQAYTMDTNLQNRKSVNVLGAPAASTTLDMCLLALDLQGNAYMATNTHSFGTGGYDDLLLKTSLPFLTPTLYKVNDGHPFIELASLMYYPAQVNGPPFYYANGFNGMAANKALVVTYDGATLKKWAPGSGVLEKSIAVTSTPFLWGGTDMDCASNIYVGNYNSIDVFDSNLTQLYSVSVPDTIYDVKLGNNNVYACGKKFVSSTPYSSDSLYLEVKRTPPTSCSACDGKAAVYIKGCGLDSASYTYQWSNGQTTALDTGLCNGTFTVSVTINCLLKFTDTINFPGKNTGGITINGSSKNLSCGVTNDGYVTVTVFGGTGPYTYDWMPSGNTTDSIGGLTAGTYSIVVTDKSGDCNSAVFTINAAPAPVIKLTTLQNESCSGSKDGLAKITVSSGTPTYTYNWQPGGGTSDSISGVSSGTYTVTVTDSKGCINTDTVHIADVFAGGVKVTTTNSCSGSNTGSAFVSVTSGSGLYIITWSNGHTGGTVSNLGAGTYYVNVRDSNSGCAVTDTFKINQGTSPAISISQTNETCYGQSIGSASVSIIGGSGSYTCNWSTGSGNTSVSNLPAGTYFVTVADSAQCSTTSQIIITQPAQINATIVSSNDSCKGKNDGTATVYANGGWAPYSYSWSASGNTNASINNLGAGNYYVTIVDTAGCHTKDSVTIIVSPLSVAITANDTICYGENIMLSVTGGVVYNWSNGLSSSSINVSPATSTSYSVVVTDNNGCKDSLYTWVLVNPLPVVNACCDTTVFTGESIPLSASGGTSYVWSPASGLSCTNCPNPIATPSQNTTYVVTATGTGGCTSIDSVLIKVEGCSGIFIPNAFTPNKDNLNNTFFPKGTCVLSYTMYVFDRWGQLIYENNTSAPWNGQINNHGKIVQEDTYIYKLVINTPGNTQKTYVGRVTVIK
ncbi:MAG TPA: gliding motility-associated C-terminal domain-containing protein [Bacteroidia bacterium]|nr:gliding motility-associated C-terminal domain-containing protein [Bacteroidia bacterium]